MKKIKYSIILLVIISSLVITACTNGDLETPNPESTITDAEVDPDFESTEPIEEQARLLIKAEPDLIEPVTVLYKAFFNGESPSFVQNDPDLLVAPPGEIVDLHHELPAVFLNDGAMYPQNDNEEIEAFIQFAVSVDGQQALINAGLLPESIDLTDQAGNIVSINLPVRRVLSAYGPVTAMIYSVDAENRFVSASYLGARDPLGSSVMEKVDSRFPDIQGNESFSQSEFNIEEAAMLEPDLIIGNARSGWLETVAALDVPVFLYDAETSEALKEAVLLTGQIFGPHSTYQADAWVRYYESIVGSIEEKMAEIPVEDRVEVLFTGTEPLRVASGDMFQSYIIETAGGISASSELEGYWNNINLEQVVIWDPDVIIVPPYGGASVEAITESDEWQILDAVKDGKVYRMPKLVAPWDTPAPDAVLGIIWMAQQLYPEQIDLDCSTEAEFFYNTFFDYEITDEEIAKICSIN
ncbi:MAG: ABC transporter substrate-binding protein [Brevefilum sp.]|nr:ABC transporter substrate-binding protein [Brevefilum sp.]MDW7755052.1 ABC transporter substrate-binding protein [Brevefilum sp.]